MYNASNWDRKQHAADTEKRPKERDRKQNKERMQPRTAADHLGINVVRVNLLNHEQTENREHAMQRTRGDGRDREGRQHTEKRTEIGNDVEHTVEQSDDDRVRAVSTTEERKAIIKLSIIAPLTKVESTWLISERFSFKSP